jgi:hypothetical protein
MAEERVAERAKKKRGLVGRIKDALTPRAVADDADLDAEGPAFAEEPEPVQGARLQGSIVLHRESFLTIEAEVDTPLDWTLTDTVEVELADGTWVYLSVDEGRSTASEMLETGQLLRITLLLDAPIGAAPVRVTAGAVDIEL